jgi:hypothetical protein
MEIKLHLMENICTLWKLSAHMDNAALSMEFYQHGLQAG